MSLGIHNVDGRRTGRPRSTRLGSFGIEVQAMLARRGVTLKHLVAAKLFSEASLYFYIGKQVKPPPKRIDMIADFLKADEKERLRLHHAACMDLGYRVRFIP